MRGGCGHCAGWRSTDDPDIFVVLAVDRAGVGQGVRHIEAVAQSVFIADAVHVVHVDGEACAHTEESLFPCYTASQPQASAGHDGVLVVLKPIVTHRTPHLVDLHLSER